MPSRRDFLLTAGGAGASLSLGYFPSLAGGRRTGQREADTVVDQLRRAALTDPITVTPLRGNLHCLANTGGNVTALSERDAVLLVDSGLAGSRMAAMVGTLTPAPIQYLVNTHWHFDHTDGNAWLGQHGATIIAHENTRRHLSAPTRVEDYGYTFAALEPEGLPHTAFSDRYTLDVGSSTVALTHYPPAHTDGDVVVRFEAADVLHVADTWWNRTYPFIDYSTGGSIDGLIAATELNLAAASPTTVIVPGHGPIGNRSDLRTYREMLLTARERIASLKRRGHNVEEIINASPTAAWDATWGNGWINPAFFIRLVYKGVS